MTFQIILLYFALCLAFVGLQSGVSSQATLRFNINSHSCALQTHLVKKYVLKISFLQ